ncbi:FtsK/SpoIIIE domain-containing protein [Actinokineospora sp. NBRC 105648]|uniref:FtsK/SpoIIIE domain-containing protein n=1 Tax=Actinokineospora sp. NBRC 105648 TaxID=3032206 RepID=UPI0024A42FEE|nr:FtsK/SpoIIIE domain-containing protein [Actinokineospora sp. NBRC 105648]GLZ40601.1 cell division protein FtsK [Actinokineospora sp. NBRC 105648]
MRVRVSVRDPRIDRPQDVAIECDPDHRVGEVLDLVAGSLGLSGNPAVDGAVADRSTTMGDSAVRDGCLLDYSGLSRAPAASRRGPLLRVLSGADTGQVLPLERGRAVVVGRGPGVDLDLADTDVSRMHASVRWLGDRTEVVDLGSVNKTRISHAGRFADVPFLDKHRPVDLPPGERFQVGGVRLAVEVSGDPAVTRPDGQGRLMLNRAPRHRVPAPTGSIALPSTPSALEPMRVPILLPALAALVPGVVLALVFGHMIYLLFAILSPLTALGMWWQGKRTERTRKVRVEGEYAEKVGAARRLALAHTDDEDAHLRGEWPEPRGLLRAAMDRTSALWQRLPADDDWLRIRLGTASRPPSVPMTGPIPVKDWPALSLVDAPHGVDLGSAGALGIAGAPGEIAGVLDWVLLQTAVLHGPDLRIAVIAPNAPGLAWARWLPHVRRADGSVRAAWTDDTVAPLVAELTAAITRNQDGRTAVRPHTLVVLVGTARLGARSEVAALLRDGAAAGLRFVCVDSGVAGLPAQCTAVLSVGAPARLWVSGRDEVTLAPDRVDPVSAEDAARSLAPLRLVGSGADAGFPDVVRLGDLMPDTTPAVLAARWATAADETSVPVGVDPAGPVSIDISDGDRAHGPHGVVVGRPGSGKSEFLITLLTSLAVANPPSRLNFLFVDYKGGATFRDLRRLPHVVGEVTNLSGSPTRVLTSLRTELDRREVLFDRAGVGNFTDYGLAAEADTTLPPLARLVIVIDEFAELNARVPKVVEELVSVTRKGRSVGVHLILATQVAGDVGGSMIANMRMRVCLRVFSTSDSSKILNGRDDAALMPAGQAGRAFVLREDELREVQPAWSAAPAGDATALPARAVPLHWDDTALPARGKSESNALHTDLHDLLDRIAVAAEQTGLVPPHRPWVDPLPRVLTLDELMPVPDGMLLGCRDEPLHQRQDQFSLPLGTGNLLVIGGAGTGRSTALRGIAAGLVAAGPVAIYAVDGARGLADLAGLPQCGAVIPADETWRIDRLFDRLEATTRERLDLLSESGFASLAEWRAVDPVLAPVHIVVFVDDADTLHPDRSGRFDRLTALSVGAQRAGITFCLSTRDTTFSRPYLRPFAHQLCLRVADGSRVGVIELPRGVDVTALPAPGRAVWCADGTEVQFPVLTGDLTGPAQRQAFLAHVERAVVGPDARPAPFRVDGLPKKTTLAEVLRAPGKAPAGFPVLFGLSGDEVGQHWVDAAEAGGVITVAGPPKSGRSTAVSTMAVSLARTGVKVVLVRDRACPEHGWAAADGVDIVSPDRLADLVGSGIGAVVVDDADRVVIPDEVVARLGGADGPLLIGSAQLDRLPALFGATALVKKLAATETGVLLAPTRGTFLGVTFGAEALFACPPGRGHFVGRAGRVVGQVPLPG